MRRLRDAFIAKPERVLWLIAAYCVAAIVLRLLRTEGLQADESEQIVMSQFLLLGYGRQPPFYNWLQYGVIHLIGPSIFALTLLKNSLLFLCCLFVGLAVRQVSERKEVAAAAMLGVLSLPAVSVLAQRDLSHAVALLFCVSLFFYGFLGALKRPALWRYALTGFAIGIGLISKYNFIVVPIAAILAILPEKELRLRLLDRRLITTIVIAGLICLPHALWFFGNIDAATEGTIDEMRDDPTGHFLVDRLDGIATLIGAAIKGALPLVIFMAIAFGRELWASRQTETIWTRVTGRMFLLCLLIVGLISFGLGATTISQKWLSPFLLILPVYLCLKIEAAGGFVRRPNGVAVLALPASLLAFGFLLYLMAGNVLAPLHGRYQKDSFPSMPFVRQVLAEAEKDNRPDVIVADGMTLAAGARITAPDIPTALPGFRRSSVFIAPQGRMLVIWNGAGGPELPHKLGEFLRSNGIDTAALVAKTTEVAYPFTGGRDTERFNYAWTVRP
ncbi:ArnT family glycosyltransferase [Aliirhizobium smilacinae]|uniref:Phospholipid carrier-dependent glycosyltransferase n=1 Tax=Aliirhizobium smilacinae TaxID=1395944 RepID=A0A5C4XRJ4_9HYPH|nr:glycosyltransferase family 39 protein [Rhizobium smilacinae]TNM65601.1 phospholipid carrier-dependent glycosyltransferase [Rhizobium smilacinae]